MKVYYIRLIYGGCIMNNDKLLEEETISDIILCEPITRKGKEALERLGLTTTDISSSYFYNNLRVASRFDKDKTYVKKYPSKEMNIIGCIINILLIKFSLRC